MKYNLQFQDEIFVSDALQIFNSKDMTMEDMVIL
jgi:hypothetical protein